MDSDLTPQTETPRKLRAIVISSALVAALVAGGGVYSYQKNQSDKAQSNMQAQINSLQQQLVSAETPTIPSIPTATATPVLTPPPSIAPSSTPTATVKTVYSNNALGFSFSYPTSTSVTEITSTLNNNKGGVKVIHVVAPDFTADINVARANASGEASGSGILILYRNNQLSDPQQVSKTSLLTAHGFSFSVLDVIANPPYVSAFGKLANNIFDVDFTSIKTSRAGGINGTAYYQADLPQSAKDLLDSFTQL